MKGGKTTTRNQVQSSVLSCYTSIDTLAAPSARQIQLRILWSSPSAHPSTVGPRALSLLETRLVQDPHDKPAHNPTRASDGEDMRRALPAMVEPSFGLMPKSARGAAVGVEDLEAGGAEGRPPLDEDDGVGWVGAQGESCESSTAEICANDEDCCERTS
ncbi:hypothetical protein BD289DRAFT_444708, partial [Coniella lustricola]